MPPPPKRKKTTGPKPVKIYNKDIICLPHQLGDNVLIPIPRGEKKVEIGGNGPYRQNRVALGLASCTGRDRGQHCFCLSVWSVTRRSIAVCLLEVRR